ncbi:hypothetical protein HPO96_33595 [Kribbella sandramycini]|uniref:Streptogrisin C n=1 Tax=Kribbella sandramycini TaxID=60450 RepID=A0A7Y4L6D1_9ACTN|nr:hypothetical protein [Kribbella sandramycini]MBB6570330.1 hypothetical protein [Kribbella sandramycini]NOL45194.1 hypothetical protein [Kribbella sandramycini]
MPLLLKRGALVVAALLLSAWTLLPAQARSTDDAAVAVATAAAQQAAVNFYPNSGGERTYVLPREQAGLDKAEVDVPVRVSRYTTAEVDQATRAIAKVVDTPEYRRQGNVSTLSLDGASDTVLVETTLPREVWPAIEQASPIDVTVRASDATSSRQQETVADAPVGIQADAYSRALDPSPHFGGAIVNGQGRAKPCCNTRCTTGIAVKLENGRKAMTTAGHCFRLGASLKSGMFSHGNLTYNAPFPANDFALIDAVVGTRNHSGPGGAQSHGTVQQSSARSAVAGLGGVCISGGVSGDRCNLEIWKTAASLCDAEGCTHGLAVTVGPCCAQNGDSGAMVFTQDESGRHPLGSYVGSDAHNEYFEKWTNMAHTLEIADVAY